MSASSGVRRARPDRGSFVVPDSVDETEDFTSTAIQIKPRTHNITRWSRQPKSYYEHTIAVGNWFRIVTRKKRKMNDAFRYRAPVHAFGNASWC